VIPIRIWSIPSVGSLHPDSRRLLGSFDVDIDVCTSFPGFSYRTGGWNPHVATLEEYLSSPDLTYEESTLCRLYNNFIPRTLQELFLEGESTPMRPLDELPAVRRLFRYIWAVNPAVISKVGKDEVGTGHNYFGPGTPQRGKAQFDRLIRAFKSIEAEGFRPEAYGPVKGYFLADDTSYRFVVGSGNHRLAALKALGHTSVTVGLTRTHPAVIHRSHLDSWDIENGGPFAADTARALFEKLLNEDGLVKARNLGLVDPVSEMRPAPQ
jgi:hypothetical protein